MHELITWFRFQKMTLWLLIPALMVASNGGLAYGGLFAWFQHLRFLYYSYHAYQIDRRYSNCALSKYSGKKCYVDTSICWRSISEFNVSHFFTVSSRAKWDSMFSESLMSSRSFKLHYLSKANIERKEVQIRRGIYVTLSLRIFTIKQ